MAEEQSTKEIRAPSSNILSHNYCDRTFKNVLRGKPEDVIKTFSSKFFRIFIKNIYQCLIKMGKLR